MCGIAGVIDYNTSSCVNQQLISRMCGELRHRGPDDQGIFINKSSPQVGLGHRRLSIIDLSPSGRQPMANEKKNIWLVFNGEIYNYHELRPELENKGHVFCSSTDSETIIHLYEEYGEDCVKFLRGMFAFALWDETRQTLLLARDRVGKKPLLYHHRNNKFCFASEFCALLASGLPSREINPAAVDCYLSFGYIASPLTIYKDVFKLPPAHILILKNNNLTIKKYWELQYSHKVKISEEEACSEALRLLKEATKIRLYSDVPLGAFLSGGIDSSTVVALMSEISPKRVKTFSIGFEEKDYSELQHAKNIARKFNTEHHEFIVKPRAMEVLPLLVERYGEPYADSSCIPTYYVSLETKRHVTVALNGDGGDESFAGYERYQAMMFAQIFQKVPRPLRELTLKASRLLPDSSDVKNKLRRIRRFINAASLPLADRYIKWVSIFNDDFKRGLYSEGYLNILRGLDRFSARDAFFNNSQGLSALDMALNADVRFYLPEDLLVKMDIASMANSLEARSPFLDHKLMEFAASLPAEYKMKRFVKKYILKKIIKGLIPRENVYRKKMGFALPVGEWFRNELKGFLSEAILAPKALSRGYFRPGVVKGMIGQHVLRQKDYTNQLWALLMLELWHRRFID